MSMKKYNKKMPKSHFMTMTARNKSHFCSVFLKVISICII